MQFLHMMNIAFLSLVCLRFVKQHLHGGPPDSLDAEALKKEVEELRQKNKDLEEQVAQLQAAVRGSYTK